MIIPAQAEKKLKPPDCGRNVKMRRTFSVFQVCFSFLSYPYDAQGKAGGRRKTFE